MQRYGIGTILDIHELAAGKLTALFARTASRDLFDAHYLLEKVKLDKDKLKLAFVTYLSMSRVGIEELAPEKLVYDIKEVENQLKPVLQQTIPMNDKRYFRIWFSTLVEELKEKLSDIVDFSPKDIEFITLVREKGHIEASLITKNRQVQDVIETHPAIQWACIRNNQNQSLQSKSLKQDKTQQQTKSLTKDPNFDQETDLDM